MKVVVKKRFRDKYTDEVYEAGRELELTLERYAEIRATDAELVVAVVEESEQTAGQQGTADSETEDATAAEAAGQTKQKRVKKQDKQGE